MIAPMEKLLLAGPKRIAPEVLLALQRAGVVQIETLRSDEIGEYRLSEGEEERLRRWDEVALSADHALRLLGLEADPSAEPLPGGLEEAEGAVFPLERRAEGLAETRERLRDELQLISRYREVVAAMAEMAHGLDESERLGVLPLLLEEEDLPPLVDDLASALEGRFALAERRVHGRPVIVIVVLKREVEEARGILGRRGLSELPQKGEHAGMTLKTEASHLEERLRTAPQDLARTEEALERLGREAVRTLQSAWTRARNESMRLDILRALVSGRYGFALFGWVPARLEGTVREAISRFEGRVLYGFAPVEDHEAEQVPVMLQNPRWISPFESLISFLNTPRYGTRDPTWVVALFFPLWFGMIVGDIGYALVFAAAYGYLAHRARQGRPLTLDFFKLRLPPDALRRLLAVLAPMIAWTLVWGGLYGEFFGDLLQRLGLFGTARQPGLIPILIPRTDTLATANGLILLSIGFGVYQVLYGFYLKASRTRRLGEKRHFWEAGGYLGGVAALVIFSYAFMTGDYRPRLMIPVILGGAAFLVGVIRARTPLMLAELPTQGGHILSYIRIYAVGLASAILANLATNLGFALYHVLGFAGLVLGLLAGVLIALLIHAVLLVLLTVSHVLQPIRLIWVEFFTKFDFYTLSGRPYRPFRTIGNFSSVKK